ncbi:hypothetical protein GYH30_050472 [Glycine max]|uniref:Signal peptidase complex subunit 1 n=1 Tax=Glycine max TaxID=3847 RepID=A0A0R0F1J8_SOYBN|nr:hypothetical protein GYH30_050472 [Glycine max]
MDWQGQKITEQLMQLIIVAFAVIAFATGYLMASFQMMILIYVGGVVLTTLDPHICWWCGLYNPNFSILIDPSLCPLKK